MKDKVLVLTVHRGVPKRTYRIYRTGDQRSYSAWLGKKRIGPLCVATLQEAIALTEHDDLSHHAYDLGGEA